MDSRRSFVWHRKPCSGLPPFPKVVPCRKDAHLSLQTSPRKTPFSQVGLQAGDYAVAIPVALYFLGLWVVRDRFALTGASQLVLPVFAVFVLVVPLLLALEGVAMMTVLCVLVRSCTTRKRE